ncbi:replication initiator [Pseudonocardia sp. NPDC046786]|uniref:replication initiator n=1 Tax=Pseudonocardia sp. NPDC046786 TaxID=3155471 RepID=UPI0033FFDC41
MGTGHGSATVDSLAARRLSRLAGTTPATDLVTAASRREDFAGWLRHVTPAAGCAHPIRLSGTVFRVEQATGRITSERHTSEMPDGLIYTACGNRRASVCPSCAETYRADTFQLVTAGLVGGKGTPASVAGHPCVFLTVTAPSFGPVHTHRTDRKGRPLPCRPRRDDTSCEHDVPHACWERHTDDDPRVGRPLCLDCYDHPHQAVWNLHVGELWRRTMIAATRNLRQLEKLTDAKLRLSYTKVAEFQARGAVHLHALVRLDGRDPDPNLSHLTLAPPPGISAAQVALLLRSAVTETSFQTAPHPYRPDGWHIAWGEQVDPRPVRLSARDLDDRAEITTTAVAAYLAKYATKATETAGHLSTRLRPDTVRSYTDHATHAGRQIDACWRLGQRPRGYDPDEWATSWGRLWRWAHMLGFAGHFATRSRRYSTTLTALRQARRDWQRDHANPRPAADDIEHLDDGEDTTEVAISALHFAGIGWHTTADALLANTAAAQARARRRTAREELTSTTA